MPDNSSSNVKIYDRPERKGPTPLLLVLALLVVLLGGFLLYKVFYHPTAPPVKLQSGHVPVASVVYGSSQPDDTFPTP